MNNTLRTIRAIVIDGLRILMLPIAHTGNDRILTAKEYEDCLDWDSRTKQAGRSLSVLSRLRRAARRQEKLNAIGLPRYIQLQQHAGERWFAWGFHIRIVLFFLAVGYTGDAFEHLLSEHYPLLFIHWVNMQDWLVSVHDEVWRWIWEQMIRLRGSR